MIKGRSNHDYLGARAWMVFALTVFAVSVLTVVVLIVGSEGFRNGFQGFLSALMF